VLANKRAGGLRAVIGGLLPIAVSTLDRQVRRVYGQYRAQANNLRRQYQRVPALVDSVAGRQSAAMGLVLSCGAAEGLTAFAR
jgi:hypothetical protein